MQHFYFDHNATTPVPEAVLRFYTSLLGETFGNASSIHHFGQQAKARLERARRQVAGLIHCDAKRIVFVSGGTEADNLAILGYVRRLGAPGRHVVTTAIEHPAVLGACRQLEREGAEVSYVAVGASGAVDPGAVRKALRPNTVLVSVMHVNNETGCIQPVEEIAAICREAEAPFHCDGVQAGGKLPSPPGPPTADFYVLSGHKFGAPKGVGTLYVREGIELEPVLRGGRQELGLRPGTHNVPGAAAMGEAARLAARNTAGESLRLGALRDRLERAILDRIPGSGVNGHGPRVGNTTNIYFDGVGAESMLIALDLQGYAVATGSACSSGAVEASHVLTAMGCSKDRAKSSLRFSLGPGNDGAQVDGLIEAVVGAVEHLRKISPVT